MYKGFDSLDEFNKMV